LGAVVDCEGATDAGPIRCSEHGRATDFAIIQPKDSVSWDLCCSVRNRRAWSGCIIHGVSTLRAIAAAAESERLTGSGATFSTVTAAAV